MTGWLENEPYPGVRECLQALQGAGRRMYVATSKLETMARQVLAHFDLLQYFAGVCGGSAAPMTVSVQVASSTTSFPSTNCTVSG